MSRIAFAATGVPVSSLSACSPEKPKYPQTPAAPESCAPNRRKRSPPSVFKSYSRGCNYRRDPGIASGRSPETEINGVVPRCRKFLLGLSFLFASIVGLYDETTGADPARQARVYSDGRPGLPNPSPCAEGVPGSPRTGSTLWGEYRGFVIAAMTIAAVQTLLIAGLLVQRARVRRTRNRLRESEKRYRQLIESQTDLVCRYRQDTTLTFVNEAYCRFFGLTRQGLIGKKYIDLVAESERDAVLNRTESVVSERKRATFDHELVRPDGGRAWYHWDVYPIADARGRIGEFQAIGRDITDRKRAEEADRNLAHALRLAVAGELTAMVAHEVSQPLGAIMANADAAQMLLDADDPPLDEIRQILLDIRDSDRRADQAVRRMRSLLGKRELNMQPLDLNESVTVALGLVTGDALHRGIHIRSELTPELPLVSGDPAWLQQVMLNLIVNAMDAVKTMSPAERRLTVATKRLEGDCIGFAVSDNGNGIPDDNIEQIFQSFYSTKRDGLGVGLAICRSIIDSHHGRIWAENNADGGATVQFCVRAA